MMHRKYRTYKIQSLLILLALLMGLVVCSVPRAEEAQSEFAELRARLTRLRQEDPEAFHDEIARIKQSIREDVNHLKYSDPDAYQNFVENRTQYAQRRMDSLKETNPEKYHWLKEMRQRRLEGTVSEVGSQNPDSLQNLRQENESFKNWTESNPRVHRWMNNHARKDFGREPIHSSNPYPQQYEKTLRPSRSMDRGDLPTSVKRDIFWTQQKIRKQDRRQLQHAPTEKNGRAFKHVKSTRDTQ